MSDYYIGIMTGNSMDAVDMVYAAVAEESVHPIYTYSQPFTTHMQTQVALLREQVKKCQCREEVEQLPLFQSVHDTYIHQIASSVVSFIQQNKIDLTTLKAICSHGKTLDHCPPSVCKQQPYTLQMGSGQMLADEIARGLSGQNNCPFPAIRVIYDFRSDDIFKGGEGAPLIPPLNGLIARQEGCLNRIDINAGNTSNLCLIQNGQPIAGWDIGPCNEYMDFLVRTHTNLPFDKDGELAIQGQLDTDLLQDLFKIGSDFYTTIPPRSGDPAYYHTQEISVFKNPTRLVDNLYTCAYFAAYLTVFSFQFIKGVIPGTLSLFGGGWKHPIIRQSLEKILHNKAYILPSHEDIFADIYKRLGKNIQIDIHPYGQWMESLLWVRMGYCFDKKIPWTNPALTGCKTPVICGIEAFSNPLRQTYTDKICRAYK